MSSKKKGQDEPAELSESQPVASTSSSGKKKSKKVKKSTEESEQEHHPRHRQEPPADQQDTFCPQHGEECHMIFFLSDSEINEACYFIRHHEFIFDRRMKLYGNQFEIDEAFTELATLMQKDKYQLAKWFNAMVREYEDICTYISSHPDTYYLNDFTENIQDYFSFLRDHRPVPYISLDKPQAQISAPELESSYIDLGSDSSEEY